MTGGRGRLSARRREERQEGERLTSAEEGRKPGAGRQAGAPLALEMDGEKEKAWADRQGMEIPGRKRDS